MTNTANKIRRILAVLLTLTLLFSSSAQSFILSSAAYAEGETNTEALPEENEAPAGENIPASGDDQFDAGDETPSVRDEAQSVGDDTPTDGGEPSAAGDGISADGNEKPDNSGSVEDIPAAETAGQRRHTDWRQAVPDL